jgi:hypothetical protein
VAVVWTFPPEFTVASFDVTPHNQAGEGRKGGSDGEVIYLFYLIIYQVTPQNQTGKARKGGSMARSFTKFVKECMHSTHTCVCERETHARARAREREREREKYACMLAYQKNMHALGLCPPAMHVSAYGYICVLIWLYTSMCLPMKEARRHFDCALPLALAR